MSAEVVYGIVSKASAFKKVSFGETFNTASVTGTSYRKYSNFGQKTTIDVVAKKGKVALVKRTAIGVSEQFLNKKGANKKVRAALNGVRGDVVKATLKKFSALKKSVRPPRKTALRIAAALKK